MDIQEICKLFTENPPDVIGEKLKSLGIFVTDDVGNYLDTYTVLNAIFEAFSKMKSEGIYHD